MNGHPTHSGCRERGFEGAGMTNAFDDDRCPPLPQLLGRVHLDRAQLLARTSLSGFASTPITPAVSIDSAVIRAAMPTPPKPTIMISSSGPGDPALRTAPPPVSTAQPSTAAIDAGTSEATGTTGGAVEHGMGGEDRCTEMMEHLGARIVVESDLVSVEWERAGPIRGASRCAREFAVGAAVRTLAAAGQEHGHDLLTDLEVGDAFAEFFDDARAFVAEEHRQGPWTVAVDDGQGRNGRRRQRSVG